MAQTKEEILEGIVDLSVLDVSWLVKELEEKFGVSASAPVMVAGPAAAAAPAEAAEVEEEQTEFTVMLQEIGPNKVSVIKAVREVTPLGLKEAKDLVEAAPTIVKEGIPREEANEAKTKLETAGGTAAVR